jgi:hypothetical protein
MKQNSRSPFAGCLGFLLLGFGGLFILAVVGAIGAVVLGFRLPHSLTASTQAPEPAPLLTPPPEPQAMPNPAPAPSVPNSPYQGFSSIAFGKGWVRLKSGVTLFAIRKVSALPAGQISITYSDGVTEVAASDLPQGFLDEWGMTVERLQDANGPNATPAQ